MRTPVRPHFCEYEVPMRPILLSYFYQLAFHIRKLEAALEKAGIKYCHDTWPILTALICNNATVSPIIVPPRWNLHFSVILDFYLVSKSWYLILIGLYYKSKLVALALTCAAHKMNHAIIIRQHITSLVPSGCRIYQYPLLTACGGRILRPYTKWAIHKQP